MYRFENYDHSVLFSDLGACCEPKSHLSNTRENGKWGVVTYETSTVKGSLLVAHRDSKPENLTLNPQLKGWYGIFVGIPKCFWHTGEPQQINLRLSSDPGFRLFSTPKAEHFINEFLWKCADMTGSSVEIAKYNDGLYKVASLGWLRFVPMTETEVAAYLADQDRLDTKNLYCCYDMHDTFYENGGNVPLSPLDYIEDVNYSDAEWIALEDSAVYDGPPMCGDVERQQYGHEGYLHVQRWINSRKDMYKPMIDYGHKIGKKMCMSHRMGMWCIEFPLDAGHFMSTFFVNNKHLRCVDRDGLIIDQLSYAYPEVQDFMIRAFLNSAAYHPDAVQMMFNRGPVFLLFEEPVQNLFAQKYPGIDMRTLAVEDERVLDIHCEIMTGFVRRLRVALDEYCLQRGWKRIELHARGLNSLYDTRMRGVDLYTWAKEGLIDVVLSYPRRIHEHLPDEVWSDDTHTAIDLGKYTKYANECKSPMIWWSDDKPFYPPRPDHHGVMRGPVTLKQAIEEFVALEKEFGVTYYHDLLPRVMPSDEIIRRAQEAYDAGATHLSLWDTNARTCDPRWAIQSQLGHKDDLGKIDPEAVAFGHDDRCLRIGGIDISRYNPGIGG